MKSPPVNTPKEVNTGPFEIGNWLNIVHLFYIIVSVVQLSLQEFFLVYCIKLFLCICVHIVIETRTATVLIVVSAKLLTYFLVSV